MDNITAIENRLTALPRSEILRNQNINTLSNTSSFVGGSGGGSWLDDFFSYDDTNKVLLLKNPDGGGEIQFGNEEGDLIAYSNFSGTPPSIWDGMPLATAITIGGIYAESTYTNGIRINSGFLEIDPSYATGGLWGSIIGTLSDQTDLRNALDSKEDSFSKNTGFNKNLGTVAGTVSEGNHNHSGVYEPANANIQNHISDNSNPHGVTYSQVGGMWNAVIGGINYAGGNVGIGTTTPSEKLHINGTVRTEGFVNTTDYVEKVLYSPIFTNGVANLAVDLELGDVSIWGSIEVTITGAYSGQSTAGNLTKLYSVGINTGNSIFVNESRVTEDGGTVSNNIALGEFQWDSTKSMYKIPISHIVSTKNNYSIRVRIFSRNNGAYSVYNNLAISSLYTLTALQRNYINFNKNVGFGGQTSPAEAVDVSGNIKSSGEITAYST